MFELVAEDAAIEDALYHFHSALFAGTIDIEVYLKVSCIQGYQSHNISKCGCYQGTNSLLEVLPGKSMRRSASNSKPQYSWLKNVIANL
jgi:hypothetical protein